MATHSGVGDGEVVRVTVTTPRGGVDLTLPPGVAVAEVSLELADRLGLDSGFELRDVLGDRCAPDQLVGAQMRDGMVLQLVPAALPLPGIVFDDLHEALSLSRSDEARGAGPVVQGALAVGFLLGMIAALAGVSLLAAGPVLALMTGVAAVALLIAGLSSAMRSHLWSSLFIWSAGFAGAATAYVGVGHAHSAWLPGAVLGLATGALVGLERGREWVVPMGVVAGGWLIAFGLAKGVDAVDLRVGEVLIQPLDTVVIIGLLVIALSLVVLPGFALARSGFTDGPTGAEEVADAVGRADQVLMVGLLSAALAQLVAAPLATSLTPAGAMLAASVSACFLLMARNLPTRATICAAIGGGSLSLALALAVALATQPTWRPGLIVISTLLAGALAWGALCSGRAGVHLALFADRAEWLARASLLPQAVWALGLVPWAKGGG